ncbi:MAG: metallophosphoesterase [Eubacteriales bacterium]|nr:metallophosphoesterase [Eubacteriales bacterium]
MRRKLITSKYYLNSSPKLKLALVTDLHEQNPDQILKKLSLSKPDLILVAGDTMERHEPGHGCTMEEIDSYQTLSPNWTRFCNLLKGFHIFLRSLRLPVKEDARYAHKFLAGASKIAPVYLSKGNHEWYFLPEDYAFMKKHHITILDNADCEVTIKNHFLRIGGLSTKHDISWLKEYGKKDGMKILLCHHPEYYPRFILNDGDPFDLVLSGHVHGGQWRIFGHGILAPGQGFLPIYHHGRYGKMIVSAGSANPSILPRFGNPTELVFIYL